jgi:hypothetical protein
MPIYFSPLLWFAFNLGFTQKMSSLHLIMRNEIIEKINEPKKERCNNLIDVHPIYFYFHQNIRKYAF